MLWSRVAEDLSSLVTKLSLHLDDPQTAPAVRDAVRSECEQLAACLNEPLERLAMESADQAVRDASTQLARSITSALERGMRPILDGASPAGPRGSAP